MPILREVDGDGEVDLCLFDGDGGFDSRLSAVLAEPTSVRRRVTGAARVYGAGVPSLRHPPSKSKGSYGQRHLVRATPR